MVKIEDGLRLQIRVSRSRPWDLHRIREASEEGSGGWSCDIDRHYLIWLATNGPEILAELKKRRESACPECTDIAWLNDKDDPEFRETMRKAEAEENVEPSDA